MAFQRRTGGATGGGARRRFTRRKGCRFCADKGIVINYKKIDALKYFVSERGKITPRRISGNCAIHQRKLTEAIKQARNIALLSFTAGARPPRESRDSRSSRDSRPSRDSRG